jgi:hypothetical protein
MSALLRAGVARAITTPPVGIAHGNWGAQTHTRAEGVDLALWATALVLAQGDTQVAIIDVDLLLMNARMDASISVEIQAMRSGSLGLVAMPSDYAEDGYGVWNSPVGPGGAEALIETSATLLRSLA